jgi:hypothetical protein
MKSTKIIATNHIGSAYLVCTHVAWPYEVASKQCEANLG